ncbi:MAG: sigma-70 family RNA polymerase sigma factor [Candidatus Doudnabacteria bacterium]|nr:sigma-70 family RNA polymerase sigma factor [Candidatus Doudnabacteria bacterium]
MNEVSSSLLEKARKGEEAALAEIYELYFKSIYRFIFYRVSHKETAEDLTEEVFIKAFSKLGSLSGHSSFKAWLYQIARNLVIDYYRQKKQTVALEDVENILEYESNIIDTVNLSQQQKVLLNLMKELGAEQQVVIKLKFFEDLSNGEIAELLHKNEGAIRVIQHRALARLQELIKQQGKNE